AIKRGPSASGVYARFSPNGRTLIVLDQSGRPARTLGAGAGLIAATAIAESAPVWVVTGTDSSGVERAARSFSGAVLADRFAGAAAGAGVGHELRRALRTALIIVIPIVLVNVLVSRHGLTVFARLGDLGPFGQGDLTLEALVYGAVVGLKVTILILVATLASLAVDPDELLRIVRRLSFRSALTMTLAVRMIPLLAADSRRLAEARRTRARGAPSGARGRISLLAAILGGALDRATDVAAPPQV